MTRTQLLGLLLPFVLVTAACAAETTDDTSDPSAPSTSDGTTNADDEENIADQSQELTTLTYATVGPIVTANCGGCHSKFKTLAGIKQDKTNMFAMLNAGAMPRGNPGFKNTAKGKKVLKWLKTGTDLR